MKVLEEIHEEIVAKIQDIREKLEAYLKQRTKRQEREIERLNNIKAELEKLDKFVAENFPAEEVEEKDEK